MSKDFHYIAAIVLAAGKGTRMNSELPKVLHTIEDKPIVQYTLNTLDKLGLGTTLVVVGYKEEQVRQSLGETHNYISQKEQLGTGHAVLQALPNLPDEINTVLVLNGDDSAFYKAETLAHLINQHLESGTSMTILTTIRKDAAISGRVIRNAQGQVTGIKANSKMSEEELKKNNELICGLYLFKRQWLEENLPKVEISPKGEYNITGLIDTAIQQSSLQTLELSDPCEWQSINTQEELEKARKLWKSLSL